MVFKVCRNIGIGFGQGRQTASFDRYDAEARNVEAQARLERGEVDPRMSTLMAGHKAVTEVGIEFLPADVKGEG